MAKILRKSRIDSVDAVDRGAGESCVVKLVKRDTDASPAAFTTREAALQAAADSYGATVAKSDRGSVTPSEYDQYRSRLFKRAPVEAQSAPLAPVNKAFDRLQTRAQKLAGSDPTLPVEQHFAKLCEDPANASLFAKAKRPASATARPAPGTPDVGPEDEDEVNVADLPDDEDGDDRNVTDRGHDGIGTKPFEGASGDGRGRSQGGPYLSSGANVRQVRGPR